MNKEQIERIAEILGLECKNLPLHFKGDGSLRILVKEPYSVAYAEVDNPIVIVKMMEKLVDDGFDLTFHTDTFAYCPVQFKTFKSSKPFNKDGLAEVFLEVYGETKN